MEKLSAGQQIARKHGFAEPYGLVWKEHRGEGTDKKIYVVAVSMRSYVKLNRYWEMVAAADTFEEFVEGWSEDRVLTKQFLDEMTGLGA